MSLGSLVLELQGNIARTQEDMGRLQQIVESTMQRIDSAASRSSDNIANVANAGRTIGRVKGAEEAAQSIERIGHASVGARREILVLAHELATGNFKRAAGSAMVLGERLDIMSKLASPAGIAIAAAAAAVAGFAVMALKGAEESAAFARSITLTGNFAGQTEASYNELSRNVATATGATIGSAREMAQGLISSGRISQGALEPVALAATRLQIMTGQSSEEIVRQFASMSDGALKWALEMNKQYHFVDGALYDHIRQLEQSGNEEQAMIAASEALYQHLGSAATENLGYIERAWRGVKGAISDTVDAMLSAGRAETAAQTAARINATLEARRHGQSNFDYAMSAGDGSAGVQQAGGSYDSLLQQQSAATSLRRRQQDAADDAAYRAETNQKVVDAKTRWNQLTEAHKIGAERMKEALDEAQRVGATAGASPQDIAAMQDRIRKEYQHGSGGVEHADMDSQLQPLRDQIGMQEKLLEDQQKQRDTAYRNDQTSQAAYFSQSQAAIQSYNDRIRALYDQEVAVVESAAKRATDARTRLELQTKANSIRDQEQRTLTESSQRVAELTEKQTEDTRKYADEVERLNAELGKLNRDPGRMAGQDFDRQHEHLQRQATLSGDTGTLDTLGQARNAAVAQAQMNSLKEQAEVITEQLTIAERMLAAQQETGSKGAIEGMIEEGQLRQQAAAQLAQIQQQMQAIASNSGVPQLNLQAQQFGVQVTQLQASSNVLGKTVSDTFAGSFANALDSVVMRTKTLKSAFADMVTSIEQSLTKLVSQDLANQLFGIGGNGQSGGGLFGSLTSLLSGGSGGGSGGLFSMLGSLFGGSSGDLSTSVMPSTLTGVTPSFSVGDSLMNSFGFTIPGMASGGAVDSGSLYEVNEQGPELLTVANRTFLMMGSQGGSITPNGSYGLSSGGSTFNMNISVPPGSTQQTANQQAAAIMRQAQIATARNG